MSLLAEVKQPFKMVRWQLRRKQAARRWGREQLESAPVVIGNAIAKSGSHLLIQVLLGLTQLGAFVDPGMPPLNRSASNHNLPQDQVLANLHRLQPGDISYGYFHARQPFIAELTQSDKASFFIYRDPRDMVVSQVFYATDMQPRHGMHDYYRKLSSVEERLNAAIEGVQVGDVQLSSIKEKYENYIGWLSRPKVHCLRFEDLVLNQSATVGGMLDFLARRGFRLQTPRSQAIELLTAGVAPAASGTFRRGQPGEWRQHFTAENRRRFKEATGDLLQRLGYEQNAQW